MPKPLASPYISIDDAARIFGVSTKTIRRRIADNTIPAFRAGRQIRLDLAGAERAFLRPMNRSAADAAERGVA